jgi:hypothetical protein
MVKYEPERTVKRIRGIEERGASQQSRIPMPVGSTTEHRRQVAYEAEYTYPLITLGVLVETAGRNRCGAWPRNRIDESSRISA